MKIYSSETDSFCFFTGYSAKLLLKDSIRRTLNGFEKGSLSGIGHILLARIESVAAFALAGFSATFFTLCSLFATPCILIPAAVLNLASRLPGISSYAAVKKFTQASSDLIYRICRVHAIGIPVIILFLTASGVNTFLPGLLKAKNLFLDAIQTRVAPLGPLKTLRAVFERKVLGEFVGTERYLSSLEAVEEYLRALGPQNILREVKVKDEILYVSTFSIQVHLDGQHYKPHPLDL